jgi:hypothetical protein
MFTAGRNNITTAFYFKPFFRLPKKIVLLLTVVLFYQLISMDSAVCKIYQLQNSSDLNTRIVQQAKLMGQSFLIHDYHKFAGFTYPAIVKALGGESSMIAILNGSAANMSAQGMVISEMTYEGPSKVVINHGELQCTIVQHTIFKLSNGKVTASSTLIAFSSDGGKNWKFVDANNKSSETMHKVLPNLSSLIIIQVQPKPVYSL